MPKPPAAELVLIGTVNGTAVRSAEVARGAADLDSPRRAHVEAHDGATSRERAEDGLRPVNGLQMFCFRTTLARNAAHQVSLDNPALPAVAGDKEADILLRDDPLATSRNTRSIDLVVKRGVPYAPTTYR